MYIPCFIVQNGNTNIVTTIFYHILKWCKCLPQNICLPSNMNNRLLTSSIGWVSFQIAGIILDNYARGRTKHIWFTISSDLIVDSRRWELIKLTSLDYYALEEIEEESLNWSKFCWNISHFIFVSHVQVCTCMLGLLGICLTNIQLYYQCIHLSSLHNFIEHYESVDSFWWWRIVQVTYIYSSVFYSIKI